MGIDKIACQVCGKELQEEENRICGNKTKRYETNIELKTKAIVTMGIRKIDKKGTVESIEEHRDGKIEKYDVMLDDGEIYHEITEERKTEK